MIAVLVVHDAPLVRSAWEQALAAAVDVEVVATGSEAEAARVLVGARPRVVVCDDRSAARVEVLQACARAGARLVVRVGEDHPDVLAQVLLGGACGVFSDRTGGAGLVEAVRQAGDGHAWLAPDLVPVLLGDYLPYHRRRAAARARLQDLGPGEVRLLGLVARGLPNAEIGIELHLATSTVKGYVGDLLGRLGATRSEAVALGVRAELRVTRASCAEGG